MRSHQSFIAAVLAAALLLGQWLAAAHDPDHALQSGAADACAVCVYAHGAGNGVLPTLPALVLNASVEPAAVDVVARPLAAIVRHHPIRGPPALLA